MNMLITLIHHTWLATRRSHYFERSVGVNLVIGIVLISIIFYLSLIGRILPMLMLEWFPDEPPHLVMLRALIPFAGFDLLLRFFIQGIPRHTIMPYLHLPIKRKTLAVYTLFRSWFNALNIYPFALFLPFFSRTLPKDFSESGLLWVFLGILLITGINQAVYIFLKTSGKSGRWLLFGGLSILAASFGLYPGLMLHASGLFGLALVKGVVWVYLIGVLVIVLLQYASIQALKISYPEVRQSGGPPEKSTDSFGNLLQRIPVFGRFWSLEWKLLYRNRRSRANLKQWPLLLVAMPVMLFMWGDKIETASLFFVLLMYSGSVGFFHLQYVFSWESRFFDFIATRNIKMADFIKAKYLMYTGIALLQLLLILPLILIFWPGHSLLFITMYLYATGPRYFILLYMGIGNSTRIDPDKKAHFNFEGSSGTLFLTLLLIMFSTIPFAIFGLLLPISFKSGVLLTMAITGLAFILTSKWWIPFVAGRFLATRYRNLEKYREKQ